jgi:hypothetical protein
VAALSGGALAMGGSAAAEPGTGTDGTGVSIVQVQDSTPAPDTSPDTAPDSGRDRDCPEGQPGAGTEGASDVPAAPVTTQL